MRLVACPTCHTQYDVSDVDAKSITCRCGEQIENRALDAMDARIHRCGSCGAIVSADAESCTYCSSEIIRDPLKLSLICPECYARCAERSRFCTACGVGFRPEEVRAEGYELPCPVCTSLMPPQQVAGIAINECLSCRGLWVPGDSFDHLVNRAIEARRSAVPEKLQAIKPRVTGNNPAAQQVQYRKCPECDVFMNRRNYRKTSGVIIDSCPTHGTWLDADELEQIAGFILSGGKPSPLLEDTSPGDRSEAAARAAYARILVQQTSQPTQRTQRRSSAGAGVVGGIVEILAELLE